MLFYCYVTQDVSPGWPGKSSREELVRAALAVMNPTTELTSAGVAFMTSSGLRIAHFLESEAGLQAYNLWSSRRKYAQLVFFKEELVGLHLGATQQFALRHQGSRLSCVSKDNLATSAEQLGLGCC